ncbi:beta strand repeat-containing protein [Burkholderia pseudomallei]
MLLAGGIVHAQSTRYVYDANGRVVAVTQSSGTTTQYGYDALGYVGSISAPLSTGQLAIFAFTPTQGDAGTSVTIDGQGFSSTLANNRVSFNGVVANVLSASATQLVATVPFGATNGPISVTVGNQTVTSSTSFVVDPYGLNQSYATQTAGQSVNLTFNANAGDNLELTLTDINVVGGSPNAVNVAVYNPAGTLIENYSCTASSPPGADCREQLWNLTAGTYSVTVTPSSGGTMSFHALLQADVIGPTLTASVPVPIKVGTGQLERFTFNATAGETVALSLSGVNTTPVGQCVYVAVYAPNVSAITSTDFYTYMCTASSGILNLPSLPATGTYTVMIDTASGAPISGAQLTLIPGVTGTVPDNGSSQSYTANAPSQNAYLTFTAHAGENLEFELSNISVTGGSSSLSVTITNSAGTQVTSSTCSGASPGSDCRIYLWNMAADTYSVVVSPAGGGVMTFNALLQPDIVGPALTANTSTAIHLSTGQVERFTFSATAGETVALNLTSVSTTPAGQAVYVAIYRPDVGTITPTDYYTYFDTGSSQILNLPNLPVSGIYTVIVNTAVGIPASAQLTLVSGVTGSLPANGTSQSYTTNAAGQNAYLTFTASAGANLEFALSNISVTGGSSSLGVTITNSAGTQVTSSTCSGVSPGSDCRIYLWNMAADTYSVVVSPMGGGIMTFNALLLPDIVGPALTANTPTAITLSTGQVERLTFNATAGETVALNLSGVSTTPAGQDLYVVVYRPDVGTITPTDYYTYFDTTSAQTLNLPNLPVSGTYTVVVNSTVGVPASAQLTLASGVTGTVPGNGTSQSYTANAPGENAYLTFAANAGDNLEFTLSNISVTGGSNQLGVTITNAAGTQVTSTSCSSANPGSDCRIFLWNMAAGTYSVVVAPSAGSVMAFNALLQPDIVGPALTANTPTTVSLSTGQVERLTFNAAAGETVTLNLSSVSTTPTGQNMYVVIYRPDVGTITPADYYTYFVTSSAQSLSLPNLPVSGTYTIVVDSTVGVPASGQLTLTTP